MRTKDNDPAEREAPEVDTEHEPALGPLPVSDAVRAGMARRRAEHAARAQAPLRTPPEVRETYERLMAERDALDGLVPPALTPPGPAVRATYAHLREQDRRTSKPN